MKQKFRHINWKLLIVVFLHHIKWIYCIIVIYLVTYSIYDSFEIEIVFPEAIVDQMFNEEEDLTSNELEGTIHQIFTKEALKEIQEIKDDSMKRFELELVESLL